MTTALSAARRQHVVRTPEGVAFSYDLAGPFERLLAWMVDVLCMAALIVTLLTAVFTIGALGLPLAFVALFLVQWGYFVFFEWRWSGGTPGKRLLGIRIIQDTGVRCTLERLLLRNFLRVVDSLPMLYAVGGISMLLSRSGRRLGDLAAGTVCVRTPRATAPAAAAEIRTRHNSLRSDAGARARIRQILTPREAELTISLALRREVLEPDAGLLAFERMAGWLRRRLRLDAHDGLPDERLVLNVAAVLLEERTL